jgi:hypothetical protein
MAQASGTEVAICASQQRFAIAKVRAQNPQETGELQVVKVGYPGRDEP